MRINKYELLALALFLVATVYMVDWFLTELTK